MKPFLNVGLVSFGFPGRVHLAPFIAAHPNLRLTKIVDQHGEQVLAAPLRADIVDDLGDILLDEQIDLIVVSTPDEHQFGIAEHALLADKHVIIQTPFATSLREARQLIDLAIRRNRILTVYPNSRLDGDFLTVKHIVKKELLGSVVAYEAYLGRNTNSWKPGTEGKGDHRGISILNSLGSHLVDQAIDLFGMPGSVTADLEMHQAEGELPDEIELILDYGTRNVVAILRAGRREKGPFPRFALNGNAASFIKHQADPQKEALKHWRPHHAEDWGREPEEAWGTLDMQHSGLRMKAKVETLVGLHMTFFENVYDAIALRYDLLVKPEEALGTIRVIEAARESNARHQTIPL